MEYLFAITNPQILITVIVAALAFLTTITLIKPLFERNDLRERMRRVALEREKLKEQQKKELEARKSISLREKKKGLIHELVHALNLHKLLDAESYRDTLRQAGLRHERHMIMFLAARVILPIALGVGSYVYSVLYYPDVDEQFRLAGVLAMVVFGFYLPNIYVSNLIQKRREMIQRHWSDALDLMLICVESGMSIEMAQQRVAQEIGKVCPPLAEELLLTNAELSYLGDRIRAYENMAKRIGLDSVKSVVSALVQAERYGTPLGQALRVLAQENRDERMATLERKAQALPPKLVVPMVFFFLPVIFILLLGPPIITYMSL